MIIDLICNFVILQDNILPLFFSLMKFIDIQGHSIQRMNFTMY